MRPDVRPACCCCRCGLEGAAQSRPVRDDSVHLVVESAAVHAGTHGNQGTEGQTGRLHGTTADITCNNSYRSVLFSGERLVEEANLLMKEQNGILCR